MNLITLENVSKSYSEKQLLNNVSLGINDGDKIGIIGVNGAGKSTLLKIIANRDEFYDGTLTKGRDIRIEYLSQHHNFDMNSTIIKEIFKGETKDIKLLREYEEALIIANNNPSKEIDNKIIRLQGEIDSLSLWDLETEAKTILNKLGIKDYNEKIGNLSGGQIKRVALAAALISPCDLLILDEPTNHLDSDSIEWLENYLNKGSSALIMITHDRYFLDRVANRIIELDNGNLYSYEGNYTSFLEKKSERIENEASKEEKRQSLIKKELKWVRRGAKARSTKQKARLDRFDELINQKTIKRETDIDIPFVGRRLGKKIIEIKDLSKSYGDRKLIDNFNHIFIKEERIGIVGPNGSGKTTLINIIQNKIKDYTGNIDIGETVKIACFSQDNEELDNNMKAIDYIKEGGEYIEVADGTKISASTLCERFLFDGNLQYSKIEKLSGGEKRRLFLLRILMESPNVLLLDEPTNDLDINTLTILEDFLDTFIGVVIVVSHDRYFLDRICNRIFSYEGNGYIRKYNGNFSDYKLVYEIEEEKREKEAPKEKKLQEKPKNTENKPKFSFKEAKEYEEIEGIIGKLESKIEGIEKDMIANSTSYGKLQELSKEKEDLEIQLLEKYERYEYLENISKAIEDYKNNKYN